MPAKKSAPKKKSSSPAEPSPAMKELYDFIIKGEEMTEAINKILKEHEEEDKARGLKRLRKIMRGE